MPASLRKPGGCWRTNVSLVCTAPAALPRRSRTSPRIFSSQIVNQIKPTIRVRVRYECLDDLSGDVAVEIDGSAHFSSLSSSKASSKSPESKRVCLDASCSITVTSLFPGAPDFILCRRQEGRKRACDAPSKNPGAGKPAPGFFHRLKGAVQVGGLPPDSEIRITEPCGCRSLQ